MDAGAAGVMVAPPSSLRTDAQILAYYHNTAQTLGPIPFVLQDFPLATGVQISSSVILQIVHDCPSCVMLKHEDWPGLEKISTLRDASETGGARRISILCGNGGLYLLEEMMRGADGAMTGFGYPEMMAQVIAAFRGDEIDRARDIFDAYMPMVRYEAQPRHGSGHPQAYSGPARHDCSPHFAQTRWIADQGVDRRSRCPRRPPAPETGSGLDWKPGQPNNAP